MARIHASTQLSLPVKACSAFVCRMKEDRIWEWMWVLHYISKWSICLPLAGCILEEWNGPLGSSPSTRWWSPGMSFCGRGYSFPFFKGELGEEWKKVGRMGETGVRDSGWRSCCQSDCPDRYPVVALSSYPAGDMYLPKCSQHPSACSYGNVEDRLVAYKRPSCQWMIQFSLNR